MSVHFSFWIAAMIAVITTVKVVTELNAVRALLYLIVSLLSVSVIFYILGAPFAAALEVITYAGAIMVLFIFAMMMLNLGPSSIEQEKQWLSPKIWVGPSLLAILLFIEFLLTELIQRSLKHDVFHTSLINPEKVGATLLRQYAIEVELASLLLLSGLVGAYHLGCRTLSESPPREGVRKQV